MWTFDKSTDNAASVIQLLCLRLFLLKGVDWSSHIPTGGETDGSDGFPKRICEKMSQKTPPKLCPFRRQFEKLKWQHLSLRHWEICVWVKILSLLKLSIAHSQSSVLNVHLLIWDNNILDSYCTFLELLFIHTTSASAKQVWNGRAVAANLNQSNVGQVSCPRTPGQRLRWNGFWTTNLSGNGRLWATVARDFNEFALILYW